jgi:glycosyltransferase involved in cell wall biosynthesis
MPGETRIEVAQIVTRFMAGAGGVALRGALNLDPDRYHVTIVTGQGGPLTDRAEAAGMRVVIVPSLVAPISPEDDIGALRELTSLCRSARFDVVHTHSAKAGALGRIAAHRAKVPLIVHTYHGLPFHEFQSPVRRSAYVAIERRLARITDAVLAIGSGVATEALRRGLADPSTLRTIAPVVEATTVLRTSKSRAAARAALGIDDATPVIGTVGRIDYQKAPEHLVAAMAALRHRDAMAVWIGSGPRLDEVEALVRAAGLGDRFLFAGERTNVAELLPAFDVFAMASRYEGLPCAVVEAMRCGVPVVATAVNSMPDLVIPGESGILVPPGRPDLLAGALDGLLDDPSTADRLVRRGRELAGETFDAARLAVVLDQVYSGGHSNLRGAVSISQRVDRTSPAASPWLTLCAAGTVEIDAREVRGAVVGQLPADTPVVLVDDRPFSRRRLRRLADRSSVVIERELIVLPTAGRPIILVDDTEAAVRHFWTTIATVPPGLAYTALPAAAMLGVARLLPWRLTGAAAPGRALIGRQR